MKRSTLYWIPAFLLAAAFALLWITAATGGEQGVMAWLLMMGGLPYVGGLFLLSVLGIAVWRRRVTRPMTAAAMLALLAIWPAFWGIWPLAPKYPVSRVRVKPAAAVRLPANVPLHVAWGGDSVWVNYHVTFPDQRWAYDLVVDPAFSESSRLDDYGCWGVPVVAPAAGKVVLARDGDPDHTPGRDSEGYAHSAGNHIFIRLATDTYLAIGHLQQGSVAVSAGDWVAEGQVVGKCGNSGSTSEPHIHIHHQRQDPTVTLEGMAEGLPLYFRDHDGPPMPEGGYKFESFHFVAAGPIVQHIASQ